MIIASKWVLTKISNKFISEYNELTHCVWQKPRKKCILMHQRYSLSFFMMILLLLLPMPIFERISLQYYYSWCCCCWCYDSLILFFLFVFAVSFPSKLLSTVWLCRWFCYLVDFWFFAVMLHFVIRRLWYWKNWKLVWFFFAFKR